MYRIAKIYHGYESRNNFNYEANIATLENAFQNLDYCKQMLIKHGAEIMEEDKYHFIMCDETTGANIEHVIFED
jgi:hypothetical protein